MVGAERVGRGMGRDRGRDKVRGETGKGGVFESSNGLPPLYPECRGGHWRSQSRQ